MVSGKMNGLKKLGMIGAAGIAVMAALLVVTQVSGVSGTLSVTDANTTPGGTASVEVVADVGEPGLGAWTLDIAYDRELLNVVDCDEDAGSVCNPNFEDGTLVRVTGASASGHDEPTVLATITFECKGEGTSPLDLDVSVFADATIGDPTDIDVSVQSGEFVCKEPAPPDVTVLTDEDVANARTISLPFDESELVVTLGEPDVYAFELSAGDTVEIDAFLENPPNFDMGLFNPSRESVATSLSTDDDERILHTALNSGTYHLKVVGENPYRLRVRSEAGPTPTAPTPTAPTPTGPSAVPETGLGGPGSGGSSASSWPLIVAASAGLAGLFAVVSGFTWARRDRHAPSAERTRRR